jgi:hypothetical protein
MASDTRKFDKDNPDQNPDPITGAPGSHPVGTGIGAAGGGAAGAAIGAAVSGPAAPAGAVVGAVIGAVAGGLAGKGAAEAVNPTAENEYWRTNYAARPYYESSYTYDEDYRPAYEYGWSTFGQHAGRRFEDVESDLSSGWQRAKGKSRLDWERAKLATRDAWERLGRRPAAGATNSAYPGASAATTTSSPELDNDAMLFARECRTRYAGRRFDDVENDLHRDWDRSKGAARGTWDRVKDSVRRAWDRVT